MLIVGGYTMWSDYQLVATEQAEAFYPGIADDYFSVAIGLRDGVLAWDF